MFSNRDSPVRLAYHLKRTQSLNREAHREIDHLRVRLADMTTREAAREKSHAGMAETYRTLISRSDNANQKEVWKALDSNMKAQIQLLEDNVAFQRGENQAYLEQGIALGKLQAVAKNLDPSCVPIAKLNTALNLKTQELVSSEAYVQALQAELQDTLKANEQLNELCHKEGFDSWNLKEELRRIWESHRAKWKDVLDQLGDSCDGEAGNTWLSFWNEGLVQQRSAYVKAVRLEEVDRKAAVDEYECRIKEMKADFEDIRQDYLKSVRESSMECRDLASRVDELECERKDLIEENEQLELTYMEDVDELLDELEDVRDKSAEDVAALESRMNDVVSERDLYIKAVEVQRTAYAEQASAYGSRTATLGGEIEKLTIEKHSAHNFWMEKMDEFDAERAKLESERVAYKDELDKSARTILQLSGSCDELGERLATAETKTEESLEALQTTARYWKREYCELINWVRMNRNRLQHATAEDILRQRSREGEVKGLSYQDPSTQTSDENLTRSTPTPMPGPAQEVDEGSEADQDWDRIPGVGLDEEDMKVKTVYLSDGEEEDEDESSSDEDENEYEYC